LKQPPIAANVVPTGAQMVPVFIDHPVYPLSAVTEFPFIPGLPSRRKKKIGGSAQRGPERNIFAQRRRYFPGRVIKSRQLLSLPYADDRKTKDRRFAAGGFFLPQATSPIDGEVGPPSSAAENAPWVKVPELELHAEISVVEIVHGCVPCHGKKRGRRRSKPERPRPSPAGPFSG
jgi:hypothetical protein